MNKYHPERIRTMNDHLIENQPLLRISEAAERLNISVCTIRTWVKQRRISTIKIGRRTLIRMEELLTYVGSLLLGITNQ